MKRLLLLTVTVLAATGWTVGCNTNRSASSLPPIEPVEQLPPLEDSDTTIAFGTGPGVPLDPDTAAIDDSAAPSARHHTISRGETLWSVALLHYGNGQRWRDIQEANPGIEPRKLRIGQEIVVP